MSRYSRILCFAAAAALWARSASAQSREADAARVYSAAFDFLFHQTKGESPRTIVLIDSTTWDAGEVAYKGELKQPHVTQIDKEAIEDFEALSHRPVLLTKSAFSYRLPIVLLTLPEFLRLDTLGRQIVKTSPYMSPQPGSMIDAFALQYPHSWGVSAVSQVGFNRSRTQALVLVANNCGNCYHSETLVFRKTAGKWILQERIPLRSQDGLGPGEVRYLGVNPQFLPRLRRTQDSTKKAVADSIRLAKAPRRIRGTITNRQTGGPISFAQILMFGPHHGQIRADSIPHPDRRVVADRRGRYTISNPDIGLAMLVILCPGPVYFDRPSLGAPGLYVFPGSDTTFNYAAQDLSACWNPAKLHQLESGWFESPEALNATVPDDDERDVFTAVVKSVRASRPGENIVAMFTHTMPPCRFDRHCGSIQLPRMVHDQVIDISTMGDFKRRASKRAAIKPEFARSLGLHLITDAEFHYYSEEAAQPLHWPARDADQDSAQFWTSFRKMYGNTAAILSLTRAGLSSDRNEALIEVRTDTARAGWNAKPLVMMLLRKEGGVWTVRNSDVGLGNTSGGWENNSCVAVSPAGSVSRDSIDALEGIFDLTLTEADGDTRQRTARIRIGHLLPPRWKAPAGSRDRDPLPRAHSFEVIDSKGNVDGPRTSEFFLSRIPHNVVRDPNIIQLDGFYNNLKIMSVTAGGFYGSYVSGVFGDSEFGYFCAQRVAQ